MIQHLVAHKTYLLRAVMEHGAADVFADCDLTDAEVIKEIIADPREWFPVGKCDNQAEDGCCLGHASVMDGREDGCGC